MQLDRTVQFIERVMAMSNTAEKIEFPVEELAPPKGPKLVVPAAGPAPPPPAKRPPILRRLILGTLILAALAGAAKYGNDWYQVGRFQISTDDAYVKTDMAQLGAKIAGYVAEVPVDDNQPVKAGDIVLKLDDGDYQLAVKAAEGRIETQKAVIDGFDRQAAAQDAQIAAAVARLASAKATVANTQTNIARAKTLVGQKVATQASLDDWTMRRDTATAAVNEATAGIEAAKAQAAVIAQQKIQSERALDELQIALDKAKRDLSFAEVKAPFDGIVANRAVEQGQYVQPGTRLMALVPTASAYIEANFKETQIADLHPGQKATITVDAFSAKTYEGKVASVSPASGAEFSLLPPENATGNFTKITQRVPVKIAVPPELASVLRPGLSVSVSVDSRDGGAN
jgi:membrane fusion protein, multidrug efflux system